MKRTVVYAATTAIVLALGLSGLAAGHEVVEVKDGAAVRGVVKVSGSVPAEETVAIDKDEQVCGKEQRLQKYLVADGRLRNTVVFIDNPKKGKAIPKDTKVSLTVKNCRVAPLVSVGFVGGNFVFKNSDDILHTIQLKLWLEYQQKASGRPLKDGATIYNIAFPQKDKEIVKPVKMAHRFQEDTGVIRVTSNAHPWMRGYVFVFDHPYAAVTDEKGAFTIDNLLPGEYVLRAWHEGFGWKEAKVKLAPNETASIEIVYEKK